MSNEQNLNPFQKGHDPRRQKGRKKGSRNTATIIRDLLETDLKYIKSSQIRKLVEKYDSRTIREAIVGSMAEKALDGNLKTVQWLFDYMDKDDLLANSPFTANKIVVEVVNPKNKSTENICEDD